MQIVSIFNMTSSPTGLPLVVTFVVPAGSPQQLLLVSGTAYMNDVGGLMQVEVLVNAAIVGTLTAYSNEGGSHKALPTAFIQLALPAGTHTLTIREKDGTQTATNNDDYFNACVLLAP